MLAAAAFASLLAAADLPQTCPYTAGPATVAVGGRPFAAEPTQDGCWLFVSLVGEGKGRGGGIALLHNEAGRFVLARTVPLTDAAAGLALSHDGTKLLVASGDGVRVLNVQRLESGAADPELGRISDGSGSATIYVALSADDRLVFASDEGAARITVADLGRAGREGFGPGMVIGRIAQGAAPVGLALSPDGTRLYATSQRVAPSATFPSRCKAETRGEGAEHPEGALSIIDVAKAAVDPAHALLAAIPAGCNPVRVAVAGDGRTAWVTARGENAVYAIDLEAHPSGPAFSRRRLSVGDSPVGVAIQPGSDRVWISNSGRFSNADGDLQRLPTSSESSTHVASGRFPRDLRFLPDGRTLVVAVFGSQAVQLAPTP